MYYNKGIEWKMHMEKLAIGLMSGTSLDGIDVALAKIRGVNLTTKLTPLGFKTYPFDASLISRIHQAMDPKTSSSELLCSLNVELAYAFAQAVFKFCQEHHIDLKDVNYIASHGQTIYHITNQMNHLFPSSLQLGDGTVLAQLTKTTVVSNFRNADIAQGGQGAPLVPFADYILFRTQHHRAIHNLGGISNFTYIKRNAKKEDIIAFDTGPGNMMIDEAMRMLYQKPYDKDGDIARSGQCIKALYDEIIKDTYFKLIPPKSTGREKFGKRQTYTWIKPYLNHPKEDIIHTLTAITIDSIVDAYQTFILSNHPLDEIIFCGGGAHNLYIIESIKSRLPSIKINHIESLGYQSDAKEALAFIILGNQTLYKEPSNIPNATGAKHLAVLGQVSYHHHT
jgi:anhydro-N-acetylmuramic acid kinase